MFKNAYIPYGGYYSSPFCKWMGSLANVNSIELGAATSKRWFASRDIDPAIIDYLYLGVSVGQKSIFYGAPWAAALMGAGQAPGQNITQACATATTSVFNAALAVEAGGFETTYCLLADRTSNGPHTIWPNPAGPGGEVIAENWNMDNIAADPATGKDMLTTAENVAREHGFSRDQADELTLRRYAQYGEALADERAFQRRYIFPVEVPVSRKETRVVEADEGVMPTTAEGLAKLRTVQPEGIHTYGTQTHPADGNAGIIVTTRERAAELSTDPRMAVQVVAYGHARTKPAHMPMAPAVSVQRALDQVGLSLDQIKTIKNHSPFIVNDLYLAKALGLDAETFNNYGTSLVFGHPQGPTLARLLIEAIEETALKGGGHALVTGCAAGDSAAALIVKVG
ncbi:thiolase family protein [Halomonas caseinilytica]|uniref:Acetyl-CoA acetyltransferase n=1 Tax=Halomonas caseinilytica TaxID=438744 RepID=A0A1M6YTV7_9GAMM|nr:thiolase family protein [Halomonas caseinilytica]SEN10621.1 Acetyl-CoA acetyltransferase [Halomonas caseinilytica]SHL21479.1 Acetyl-CoA acetyltransferase [Halomonas caseinilytica]